MVNQSNNLRRNPSFLTGIVLLMFSGLFLVSPAVSAAAQASFIWDPNPEPDVGGYRIFCREQGRPYNYEIASWEGAEAEGTAYGLDDGKVYCCVVRAFDIDDYESDDSNEVCFETSGITNHPPNADAGPDQLVNEGQSVSLNGSNSMDDDDGIVSYHWVQTGGADVTLSNPDDVQPYFTAPDVGVEGTALTFELTVTDMAGNQGQDTCVVNVTRQNEPPQANAGVDQTVNEGEAVILDGASSLDIDDGIIAYEWVQIGYPTITLSNASTPTPTFTAPPVGPDGLSLTFSLTVTDAGGLQDTDACIVNVSWLNEPPTAIINPDYLETTGIALVTLDGSASTDPDDGIASYLWTQVEGDPITFSNPTSAVTSFSAPATEALDKNIILRLTVTDNGGLKDTADSSIYVMQNEPPALDSVTISGPAQVDENSGAQYTLTATYSDGSSSAVTGFASWSENSSYTSINNGFLIASSVSSNQSCTITTSYEGESATYKVTIEDVPANQPPLAGFNWSNIRKLIPFSDQSVDRDGSLVAWHWDFGDGTNSAERNPSHRYVKFGTYVVTLTVHDDKGASASATNTVSVFNK